MLFMGVMGGDRRWPLADGERVAYELTALLSPACERIAIAGSIRRRKPDVGDIELLCAPKSVRPADILFGADQLDIEVRRLIGRGVLAYRPNVKGTVTYGPLNKLLLHVPSGIPLDIFSTDLANWGMALVVRTGSADFNKRMMTRFLQQGMKGHAYGGITTPNGEVECPDEETVFQCLGWEFIPPGAR